MNWVNAHIILIDLRLNVMSNVVVNWVSHVLRHHVLESLLINIIVVKNLQHDNEVSGALASVKTKLEDFILVLIDCVSDIMVRILVIKDVVKDLL
jgi:hypothetical protein